MSCGADPSIQHRLPQRVGEAISTEVDRLTDHASLLRGYPAGGGGGVQPMGDLQRVNKHLYKCRDRFDVSFNSKTPVESRCAHSTIRLRSADNDGVTSLAADSYVRPLFPAAPGSPPATGPAARPRR
jgi:hypothetical protein